MGFSSDFKFNGDFKNMDPKKIKRIVIIAVIALLAILVLSTCWFTVNDKQQAVITTFGKVTGTADAGIHFKLPFGIQKVQLVDVNVYHKIELGPDGRLSNHRERVENDFRRL